MTKQTTISLLLGIVAALAFLLFLSVAYRFSPFLANYLTTGGPVVDYGIAMVGFLAIASGIGVYAITSYFGKPASERGKLGRGKRFLGYGGVGFFAVGMTTILADPGAISVGVALLLALGIIDSNQLQLARLLEAQSEQQKVVATEKLR
jgi:hypothetical protein